MAGGNRPFGPTDLVASVVGIRKDHERRVFGTSGGAVNDARELPALESWADQIGEKLLKNDDSYARGLASLMKTYSLSARMAVISWNANRFC